MAVFNSKHEELESYLNKMRDDLKGMYSLVSALPDSALRRQFMGFYEDTHDELAYITVMNEDMMKKERT